jgi:hypothetical protein
MFLSPPMQHDVLNFAGTHLPVRTSVMTILFPCVFYISLLLTPLLAQAKTKIAGIELKSLEGRLKKFNALLPALIEGDIVGMDYSSNTGAGLGINDRQLGHIEVAGFFTALLKVWIGEHPADENLNKGLLGV